MHYQTVYDNLIAKRRKASPPIHLYTERHHIVPKSLGGTDDPSNLVVLTGREHWVAHLLLHKIYRLPQTAHACHMMAMRSEERGIPKIRNSRMYQTIREEHAEHVRARGKKLVGERNGSFNTQWIHNRVSFKNMKILKGDPIPKGWVVGRKLLKVTSRERQVFSAKLRADLRIKERRTIFNKFKSSNLNILC
jgi:hypothetical protein